MKVNLHKSYPMPASAEQAWLLLADVERVAACMPGARIAECIDDRHYNGTVSVRIGPASLTFRGQIEVLALEPATRTLRLVGKGTDTTGGSGATMDLTARIEAGGAGSCSLVGDSEVSMSGKAAAFGGRVAESVADQVLKQFAANFAAAVQGPGGPTAAGAAGPAGGAGAAAAGTGAPTPRPTQLNALAVLWGIFVDWLRSLFGSRRA